MVKSGNVVKFEDNLYEVIFVKESNNTLKLQELGTLRYKTVHNNESVSFFARDWKSAMHKIKTDYSVR